MALFKAWAFDAFQFLGTLVSVDVMAAMTLSRNLLLPFHMIPAGFHQSAQILIGNSIGSKSLNLGRLYLRTHLYLALSFGFLNFLLLFFSIADLTQLFSSSHTVNQLVISVRLLLAVYTCSEYFTVIFQGVITGLGKQG